MQKKLIALAVAGLISAPAFAQSNVTIYGIVDMGLNHSRSSDTGALKNRTGIDSGLQSGSRLGFRGTEDLGNGLKASFVLEQGIAVDRGAQLSTGYHRQSFLALSGNFGTVAAGRMYTPQFNLVTAIDPFGTGTVGDVSYGRGVYSMGVTRTGNIRLNNLLAYVSPNMGGMTVTAGYTGSGLADESNVLKGAKSSDAKIWAVSPVYNNGPLMVGLNLHRVKVDTLGVTNTFADLGAAYDFGAAKIAALYGRNKLKVSGLGSETEKQWMVGATIPVSEAGKVLTSYSRNSFGGEKVAKLAVGYTHDMSKRTNLYAAYAKLRTNSAAEGAFSVGGTGGSVSGDFTAGLNVGIRHRF